MSESLGGDGRDEARAGSVVAAADSRDASVGRAALDDPAQPGANQPPTAVNSGLFNLDRLSVDPLDAARFSPDAVIVDAAAAEFVAGLHAVTDAAAGVGMSGLSDADLIKLAREQEIHTRQLLAVDAALISEFSERRLAQVAGCRDLPAFLAGLHRLSRQVARRRVDTATQIGPRRSLTGEALEPQLPVVAAAVSAGAISVEHVNVITDTLAELPAPLRVEHAARVEQCLAELAHATDPRALRQLGQRVIGHLYPDGRLPGSEAAALPRYGIGMLPTSDGGARLSGLLSPTCRAIWETVLTPLTVPHDADASGPDTRSDLQLAHDAFEHAGRIVLESGDLPQHAGLVTTLMVTVDLADLERRVGRATTHHGGTLSIADAMTLAAGQKLIPVILGDTGEVLDAGRGRRLATPAQRRVLFTRDRGCTFPSCDRSAVQAEVHHATDWLHDGPTNLNNLALARGYHNNEAPKRGWHTLMINQIPHWKPPPWIDPHQTPQRNYHHHPELLTTPPKTEPDAGNEGQLPDPELQPNPERAPDTDRQPESERPPGSKPDRAQQPETAPSPTRDDADSRPTRDDPIR